MIRKLLTLTAITAASFAIAPTGASADTAATCPEYGVRSVSTGAMVAKAYTTAAFCFTGGVDAAGTLTISGTTTDSRTNDNVCAVAKVSYIRGGATRAVVFPSNCTGNRVAVPSSKIAKVSAAAISLCMVDRTTKKTIACTSSNSIFPTAKPVGGGGIVRR